MALDMKAVRAGIKTQLAATLGTTTHIATAPDQITPPCLFIGQAQMDYHQTFQRGLDRAEITLYGILPRTHDQGAVDTADEWISGTGINSVVQILHADQTLQGSCQSSKVVDALPNFWPGSTGELPAYEWTLEVYG